jgi:hypothetical protein
MDWSRSTVRVNGDSMQSLRAAGGTAIPVFGRGLKVAVAGALALPLLVFASIGGYSRYTADDFCWAGILRTEGFWNAQALWYTGYSPRYAFTFVVNLTELIGPPIVPLLPAAAILGLVAALGWTLHQFGITRFGALILAEVAALATLQTAPDLPQSLYWQTGMLTYLLPLILAILLIGWIRASRNGWWAIGLSGLITFVAGGLSETYLIPQNVALTLALLASLAARSRHTSDLAAPFPLAPLASRAASLGYTPALAASLAGGVLALLAILVAPSTAYRVGGTPADLWLAMSAAIATCAFQVVHLVRYFPYIVVLCLAAPALVLDCAPSISRRQVAITTAIVALTLPFCYFPSFYAQNGNPPARSLIVPGAIMIGYLVFLGAVMQSWLVRLVTEPRRAVVLAAMAVVPVAVAITTFPQRAEADGYAALFDAEDRLIRNAGQPDVTVPPLPRNLGEDFVTADRDNWFNVCVARYYGVRSIAASTP